MRFLGIASARLQQHLPPAVLKRDDLADIVSEFKVATTPTACGIETIDRRSFYAIDEAFLLQQHLPLAVLKHCNSHTQ